MLRNWEKATKLEKRNLKFSFELLKSNCEKHSHGMIQVIALFVMQTLRWRSFESQFFRRFLILLSSLSTDWSWSLQPRYFKVRKQKLADLQLLHRETPQKTPVKSNQMLKLTFILFRYYRSHRSNISGKFLLSQWMEITNYQSQARRISHDSFRFQELVVWGEELCHDLSSKNSLHCPSIEQPGMKKNKDTATSRWWRFSVSGTEFCPTLCIRSLLKGSSAYQLWLSTRIRLVGISVLKRRNMTIREFQITKIETRLQSVPSSWILVLGQMNFWQLLPWSDFW